MYKFIKIRGLELLDEFALFDSCRQIKIAVRDEIYTWNYAQVIFYSRRKKKEIRKLVNSE
jgi:hypothetical protein